MLDGFQVSFPGLHITWCYLYSVAKSEMMLKEYNYFPVKIINKNLISETQKYHKH